MKVVFLCGGTGKRMHPLTEDKFLFSFLGKTLLEQQIDMAKKAGLNRFVIVGNAQNIDRVEEIIGGIPDIEAELAVQQEPLGIADALQTSSRFFDDEIIIVNPNDVFDAAAYPKILAAREGNSAASYIFSYKIDDYFPGGYLVVDGNNYLNFIVEKPPKGEEPSNIMNIMIHLHSDPEAFLGYIKDIDTENDDTYERALGDMAGGGRKIKVLPLPGTWNAIKYPWHILEVAKRFLEPAERYISPSARVSDSAVLEGNVVIDDGVVILENAVIRGPAYIGRNSIIGNSVLVRGYSHIGANCNVGCYTEVKGSYIGDGCWFHMNYIGDSIIGRGCNFGAGTVLANYRFDEGSVPVRIGDKKIDTGLVKFGAIIGDNCKTGINASIMPGVRVGPNSIVGPHVCMMQDLPMESMAVAEMTQNIIKKQMHKEKKYGSKPAGSKLCAE